MLLRITSLGLGKNINNFISITIIVLFKLLHTVLIPNETGSNLRNSLSERFPERNTASSPTDTAELLFEDEKTSALAS